MKAIHQTLVDVAADRLASGRVVYETLWVEGLRGGGYRLVKTPLVAQGLAVGDEFDVDPVEKSFRLKRRSRNLTVQLFMKPALTREVFEELAAAVHELGGGLDAHTANIAGFFVPVSAGFAAIEQLFNDFVEEGVGL